MPNKTPTELNDSPIIINYARQYGQFVFVVLFFIICVFLLIMRAKYYDIKSITFIYIIIYINLACCVGFIILIFTSKKGHIIIDEHNLYFKNNISKNKEQVVDSSHIVNAYILFLPIFSSNYKNKPYIYRIFLLINPLYMLIPVSSLIVKFIICCLFKVNFLKYNCMAIQCDDGNILNIGLLNNINRDDIMQYLSRSIDKIKIKRIYVSPEIF